MIKSKLQEIKLEIINQVMDVMPIENKIIKLDITKLLRGKGCQARFIIKKQDENYVGELLSLKIYPVYIRRIIRTGTSIVEDSFECRAKDIIFIIKPFIITRKKVHRSLRNRIRIECQAEIKEFCKDKTKEEIFKAVLSAVLQKHLSKKLKKIYPLAFCDIRVIEIKRQ
jgi:ribosomal protein S3AE